jgi:2',3'-cyclic-nucleotide 2'-phosphodiesterase (5'-nucleotidase family)
MRHKLGIVLFILLFTLFTFHDASAQQYKVRSAKWKRLEVTKALDAHPDSAALAMIAPYKASVDSVMSPVLGMSRVAMSAKRPESLLSNWAADVMVEGSTATGLPAADMGLVNIGGLRNNMPEGVITNGDIILISPFENTLVVLEMKGKHMLELMHNIAAVGGEGVSSSVRMVISKDKKLISATINGEKISRKRTYTVATLDYLAEGNDKMYALKKAKKRHDIGLKTREVLMESVIKHRIIDSKIEGRIVISQE